MDNKKGKIEWALLELKSTPQEEEGAYVQEEEGAYVWKCYSCGITSEKGTFRTAVTFTDYGYEYDCVCNTCESENTAPDGEGEPICEECTGWNYGWYCDNCRKTMCEECWTWFDTPDGEPEEYLCKECE